MAENEKISSNYLKEISEIYRHGNATEHSYRPSLKTLFEDIIKLIKFEKFTKFDITNEGKRIK